MQKRTDKWIYSFVTAAVMALALVIMNSVTAEAARPLNTPLDSQDPVYFYGDSINYKGEDIALGDKAIYLDASLSDEICNTHDYVYNDFKDAANAFKNGTEAEPMKVYIAPYVYWVDDPDDPEIKKGIGNDPIPYALWINCNWLSLNGLTEDPYNVVLAVNRGQSQGAIGNYTMFYIDGQGTHTENLTMGNYCSVDLEYPLKPELGRDKRTSTVTQAQLVLTNGDKITSKNCNFISRLNSCPFVGSDKRILFEDCHFECTDDSLPGTAVYVNCDFDFYSSKPFYSTSGTGAVFLGCTFNEKNTSKQYFTKAGGIVTVIDGTFNSTSSNQYFGWTTSPSNSLRCYQYNIKVNRGIGTQNETTESNYIMGQDEPYTSVDLTNTAALSAYRVEHNGEVIYNTYNLLKGSDDWDPMGVKAKITQAGATSVPVQLISSPLARSITTGSTAKLTFTGKFFMNNSGNFLDKVTWRVDDSIKNNVKIVSQDGNTCTVSVTNNGKVNVSGMVYAVSSSGLESGCYFTVAPNKTASPIFTTNPTFTAPSNGVVSVKYALSNASTSQDISKISWYRCSDPDADDAIQVGITRNEESMYNYQLSYGDVGYYLMAKITPQQLGSNSGTAKTIIMTKRITLNDVKTFSLSTDFSNIPTINQKLIVPGFWSFSCYDPKDYSKNISINESAIGWTYGDGDAGAGAKGLTGLMTLSKGARLVYTPAVGTYGDMNVTYILSPEKNAGQLMSSAGYYMELYVKYDTATKTGYGVRFNRVAANSDINDKTAVDKTVEATIYKYVNGVGTPISTPIKTSALNSVCTVDISVEGSTLSLDMSTTRSQTQAQQDMGAVHEVHTSAQIATNTYGGIGVQHIGTTTAQNRVMINEVQTEWNQEQVKLGTFKTYNLGHVVRTNLNKCTVSNLAKQYYTGKVVAPSVTVKSGTKTLVKGRDYTIVYKNNKNIGKATVTITGIGSYKGTVTRTYTIGIKKNAKYTVGNYKYKITKAYTNGKGTVTLIGTKNKKLKRATIGKTVKIGGITFKITAIGNKAFYNNTRLTKVTIGANVKTIGKSVFQSCKKLKRITVKSTNITKVGKNAIKGINKKATVKVPKKKLSKYKKIFRKKGQAKTVVIKK